MSTLEGVLGCPEIELFMEEEKGMAWDMHPFLTGAP